MKCSELWLREWVNPALTREAFCDALTMAGLEVEEISPVAEKSTGIIIGQIVRIEKHPEADRLTICDVDIGTNKTLRIVCGASNVKLQMKVPVAVIGAVLPNQRHITDTTIRGIASEGMLCSAAELGINEDSSGLMELANDAPVGHDFHEYLQLNDYVIDISITPNRGDCLSIKGLAREIAALTQSPMTEPALTDIKPTSQDILPVKVSASQACPRYAGRIIRNVSIDKPTPIWLRERLRRSGIRSINIAVDVTNYVMLELGQPMHAFDLHKIKGGITVRLSQKGETIALLDGSEKELNDETLIIADDAAPLAIAGVMGGLDSSVTSLTHDVFLESAYFSPPTVARQRQHYHLSSDSAYRFERGVDYAIQRQALERATDLILALADGEAGPITEVLNNNALPQPKILRLSKQKVAGVLGLTIESTDIDTIFKHLQFKFKKINPDEWEVEAPSYRSDISLPEDLIEEIARLYGYDKIPQHLPKAALSIQQSPEELNLYAVREAFKHHGYHEIISYSFIDKKIQQLLDPNVTPRELVNPISADMAVMRTNLWPGLISTLIYNKSRQQNRIRLFEIGTCFIEDATGLLQLPRLGGAITGLANKEQWGIPAREADFYDLKGDLEAILGSMGCLTHLHFKKSTHPALHPGQTADLYDGDQRIGIIGALHPTVLQELDFLGKIFVFDLDLAHLQRKMAAKIQEISKFPEIRRDIALLVNEAVPAEAIQDTIKNIAGDWLKETFIFDVYQGKGVSTGFKSIAVALTLQHASKTLVEEEVTDLMERIIEALKGQLGAELRS